MTDLVAASAATNHYNWASDSAPQLAAMRSLAEWLLGDDSSGQDASSARTKADQARKILKVMKAAKELHQEALWLECCALRRCGVLNVSPYEHGRGGFLTQCAIGFANLDIASFTTKVRALINNGKGSPGGIWKQIKMEAEQADIDNLVKKGRHGEWSPKPDLDHRFSVDQARRAALELLNSLENCDINGRTVADIADDVADHLSDGEWEFNDIERHAIRELTREALRSDAALSEGRETKSRGNASNSVILGKLPKFVTYCAEDTHEWVRVPTFAASLDQLRFMSHYRNEQAAQLKAKADELAATLAQLETVVAENPAKNLSLVRDVWIEMGGSYYPGMEDEAASDMEKNQ